MSILLSIILFAYFSISYINTPLNVYLATRLNPPGKASREIHELSELLNRLGEKLFSSENCAATFRNENGVYMKLMNFRRLDPEYTAGGENRAIAGCESGRGGVGRVRSGPKSLSASGQRNHRSTG